MALDPSYIGRSYPPTEAYLVTREKIAEFADAVGDPNPAYRSAAAAQALGHGDVLAPPTFPVVVSRVATAQVIFDPQLGLDYSRVVHGEQSFTYDRPVVAGDRLVAVATVENIRSAAGNDLLTLRTDLSTPEGEHVCAARMVVVARGTADSAQEG
jgi:acyl dehydratase